MDARPLPRDAATSAPHRVVIIGGGFAGLYAAKNLGKAGDLVDVTLIDRRNHHLFQPMLYQVATGALSPGEIAQPLRSIFRAPARTRRCCWARRSTSTPRGARSGCPTAARCPTTR